MRFFFHLPNSNANRGREEGAAAACVFQGTKLKLPWGQPTPRMQGNISKELIFAYLHAHDACGLAHLPTRFESFVFTLHTYHTREPRPSDHRSSSPRSPKKAAGFFHESQRTPSPTKKSPKLHNHKTLVAVPPVRLLGLRRAAPFVTPENFHRVRLKRIHGV